MVKKIILEGKEARAKLLKGALTVSRILGTTLGPGGRNSAIEKKYSSPIVTNDGGETARHIVLTDDPAADVGAQIAIESTMKTNDRGGDGRSTTAVFQGKILEVCSKKIEEEDGIVAFGAEQSMSADVIGMSREILDQKDKVIDMLKKMARPLKKGELRNVVATSLGRRYPEYVDDVTDAVEKTGVDGYISVEDNWGTKYGVETTLSLGMRFTGSYATPAIITDAVKNESIWTESKILVTNHRIERAEALDNLFADLMKNTKIRQVVVISEGFSKEFIFRVNSLYNTFVETMKKGQTLDFMRVIPVKAPSLTSDMFKDVCAFTGSKFFDKNNGDIDLSNASQVYLGSAKKIIIEEHETRLQEGAGNVEERLNILKKQLDEEKDTAFKEQLKRRIGALTSGFGIIRVGASTEPDRIYIKKKIEDAKNSAIAALEEGVVEGGGMALFNIAKKLGKDNILFEALQAPHKKICSNCGVTEMNVPDTVLDALKVTRLAVENGCSTASSLITCEILFAEKRSTLWDELNAKLHPNDNDDFRAEENQELKYRT